MHGSLRMEQRQKLEELLEHFDTSMLTTRTTDDGKLRARPMHIAKAGPEGDLWFLTSLQSGKLDELNKDPRVGVSMQGSGKYLSLSGQAEVVTNQDVLRDLYNPSLKPWFPEGTATPDMAAIHVITNEAEYWDRSGVEAVKFAYHAARAVVEGRRPDDDPPERHGHLEL